MITLTEKQERVLDYIKNNMKTKPPSYVEIAESLGLGTKGNIHDHVKALRRKGYLDENNMPTRRING